MEIIKTDTDNLLGKIPDLYPQKLLNAKTTALFITIPQTKINYLELHNKLTQKNDKKYILTKLEQHKDEGLHIHIIIIAKPTKDFRISGIHNIIMSFNEDQTQIKGTIDYQKIKNPEASINYLKKEATSIEGMPYQEWGEAPAKKIKNKNADNQQILDIITIAEQGDADEALAQLKQIDPMKYLQYKETFKTNLQTENKVRKKYTPPDLSKEAVNLKPKQQQVWDLLQTTPKQRRIIWITGNYGSGKSFLYNYIKTNHEYGMYDAGQTASLDNLAYGYDEEGVIAWDLPRTFNFTELGNPIANVIEKFSDFGQSITSKKYNGKTQRVLGHAIVFSNHPPLDILKHRDIIHIDLDETEKEEVMVKPPLHQDDGDDNDYCEYITNGKHTTEADYTNWLENHIKNRKERQFKPPAIQEQSEDQEKCEIPPIIMEDTDYPEITKYTKQALIIYVIHYQTKQGGTINHKEYNTLAEAISEFNRLNYYQLDEVLPREAV